MASDDPEPNKVSITSNGGSRPVPDPTALTDAAIGRAVAALTDYINGQLQVRDERLRGIDEATKLRLESVISLPPQIDEKVGRLKEVHDEKFRGIDTQFKERDTRSEREARDNTKAVDAAFAAQKEAAAKQDEGNQKSIDKSEKATAEKIDKLEQLFKTTTDALRDKIDDVKTVANGTVQQRVGAKDDRTGLYAALGAVAGIIVLAIAIVGFVVATAARAQGG